MFYTDVESSDYVVPENVRFMSSTLPNLKAKLQRVVDYPIRYETAWDLCALRGVFGSAFADDIGEADFWGWGDSDMVYGDLTPCVEASQMYDKVMPKGHLSFIRNNPQLNAFIVKHPLCRKAIALGEPGLPCFDELAIPEIILPEFGANQNNGIPFINTACRPGHFVLDDVMALSRHLGVSGDVSVPFVATWHGGKMFGHFAMPDGLVRRIEVAYFHFFRRDMVPKTARLLPDRHYLIVPNCITEYDGHEVSNAEIVKLDRPRVHWAYWRKRMRLGKIVAKVFRK